MELKTLLVSDEVPAYTLYEGVAKFTMGADLSLKIETSPGGEDLLDVSPAAGKEWYVTILVQIRETDA